MLNVRSHGQENNSGLKPFCVEILLKNCGKRTSEYLDVYSNILSKWFVQIWQRTVVKCLCFLSDSCVDQKQSLLKTWSRKCDQMRLTRGCGILSSRKQIIYIIHLDLGFQRKPCLITGQIKLLPWLTFSGSVHHGSSWCLHTKNIYLLVGK